MLGKEYNLVTTNPRNEGKVLTDTFLFHSFFMMTMFNQINARIVEKDEINMFRTLQSNIIFWMVWVAEMVVQHFMLFWSSNSITGQAILGMAPLSFGVQVIAIFIGAFSFVIHVLHVKFIPVEKFKIVDDKIGIEADGGNAANQVDKIFGGIKNKLATNGDDDDDDGYQRMKDDVNKQRPQERLSMGSR